MQHARCGNLKVLGCDPNLRNYKAQTAIEAASADGNMATAAAYAAAYGADDGERRTELLEARTTTRVRGARTFARMHAQVAKRGNFVGAFAMLGERRHLCNTQAAFWRKKNETRSVRPNNLPKKRPVSAARRRQVARGMLHEQN